MLLVVTQSSRPTAGYGVYSLQIVEAATVLGFMRMTSDIPETDVPWSMVVRYGEEKAQKALFCPVDYTAGAGIDDKLKNSCSLINDPWNMEWNVSPLSEEGIRQRRKSGQVELLDYDEWHGAFHPGNPLKVQSYGHTLILNCYVMWASMISSK